MSSIVCRLQIGADESTVYYTDQSFKLHSPQLGRFFVTRGTPTNRYLHKDGAWRDWAYNQTTGSDTGFFESIEQINAIVRVINETSRYRTDGPYKVRLRRLMGPCKGQSTVMSFANPESFQKWLREPMFEGTDICPDQIYAFLNEEKN